MPQLPVPLLQTFARQALPPALPDTLSQPIYPLAVSLGNRTVPLVFFSYYLSALTADSAELAASQQWSTYQAEALRLVAEARAGGACVALLYAPTKEEVYVPLAVDAQQLAPVLRAGWSAWGLDASAQLRQQPDLKPSVVEMQSQASAARRLLSAFAEEHGLPLIDPSEAMQVAAVSGTDPFMQYDLHWSAAGHALVAEQVAAALRRTRCP